MPGSIIIPLAPEVEAVGFHLCRIALEHWRHRVLVRRTHLTRFHLMLVRRGMGRVELNGATFQLRPGTAICHGPAVTRVVEPEGEGIEWVHLALGGDRVAVVLRDAFGGMPGCMDAVSGTEAMILLEAIWRVSAGGALHSETVAARLSEAFLAALKMANHNGERVCSLGEETFLRMKRVLVREAATGISVREIAERHRVSYSYLCRLFRRFLGMSPGLFLRRLQMQQATDWLTREGWTVKAVAERLRFSDESAFSKAFKRVTGMRPGTVRGRRG